MSHVCLVVSAEIGEGDQGDGDDDLDENADE